MYVYRTLSNWLEAKRRELETADAVRGIPEEVQKQIQAVEV